MSDLIREKNLYSALKKGKKITLILSSPEEKFDEWILMSDKPNLYSVLLFISVVWEKFGSVEKEKRPINVTESCEGVVSMCINFHAVFSVLGTCTQDMAGTEFIGNEIGVHTCFCLWLSIFVAGSCYVDRAVLVPAAVLLLQSPEHWDYCEMHHHP